ncbi:MAG: LytR/AlgR family response regulator transcription factor [Ginsengibacter sp.]
MQLKCVIVDEEPTSLEMIKKFLAKIPSIKLLQAFCDVNSTNAFLKNNHIDLLFIDINMPTGIELVSSLKNKLMTIFTSAYQRYALKGFDLEAVDYLLKPLDFDRFRKAVKKAIQYYKYRQYSLGEETKSLLVRSDYKTIRIDLSDIEYIEGFVDYIKIHLTDQKPVLTLMTFKAIIEKLPPEEFKRIHRSYIVPISKIKMIKGKKVHLFSSVQLPVSKSFIDFLDYWKTLD